MSETTSNEMNDLDDTRSILAETHRALEGARQQLRQMYESMNDARSCLALVEGFQQGQLESRNRQTQGEALRSFAGACEYAVKAGQGVDRRILRAVANVKAAVVIVDGLRPVSAREEIDTGRLRRQVTSLRDDLDTIRPLLQHVTERLGSEADRSRQVVPRLGRDRADVALARVSGVLLTADTEGRHVGQEHQRAQTVTAQASRGADGISEAARERMLAQRRPPSALLLAHHRGRDERPARGGRPGWDITGCRSVAPAGRTTRGLCPPASATSSRGGSTHGESGRIRRWSSSVLTCCATSCVPRSAWPRGSGPRCVTSSSVPISRPSLR